MGDIGQESRVGEVRDPGKEVISIFIRMIRKVSPRRGDLCKETKDAPSRYIRKDFRQREQQTEALIGGAAPTWQGRAYGGRGGSGAAPGDIRERRLRRIPSEAHGHYPCGPCFPEGREGREMVRASRLRMPLEAEPERRSIGREQS